MYGKRKAQSVMSDCRGLRRFEQDRNQEVEKCGEKGSCLCHFALVVSQGRQIPKMILVETLGTSLASETGGLPRSVRTSQKP